MNINLKNLLNVYGENANILDIPESNVKFGTNNTLIVHYGNSLIKKVYRGTSKIFDNELSPKKIITCSNNQVLKINNIYISNTHLTENAKITAYIDNGTTILSFITKHMSVNAGQTVDLIVGQTSSVYLTEGQSIQLIANERDHLSAFVSYEKIS